MYQYNEDDFLFLFQLSTNIFQTAMIDKHVSKKKLLIYSFSSNQNNNNKKLILLY